METKQENTNRGNVMKVWSVNDDHITCVGGANSRNTFSKETGSVLLTMLMMLMMLMMLTILTILMILMMLMMTLISCDVKDNNRAASSCYNIYISSLNHVTH